MNRRSLLSFSIILCSAFASGQSTDEVKKLYPKEDVVMLNYFNNIMISMKDGIPVAESFHESDKLILNNKSTGLYSRHKVYHSGFNELRNLEAYTMVPDGNKYKKIKIGETKTTHSSTDNIFYDDLKETSFDFPALSENTIAHVEWSQYHKDAHLLTPFYFRSYLPLVNVSYTVTFPNDVKLKYIVKNDDKNIITFTEEKKKKETVYKWTASNIRSVENFADAPSDPYYEPHVIVYISSYDDKEGTKPFLNTVDDLFKWNVDFTKTINTSIDATLRKVVDSLTANAKTDRQKTKNIYEWVQKNIKYVAFENGLEGFRPREASDVYFKRYGDCKDMSSIITQMLRIAGLKGYYTWIGTRLIPYDYTDVPLPIVDNHMISATFLDGQWIFLDGTNPNAIFGLAPSHIQGKEALIAIDEKQYKIVRVPVAEAAVNRLIDSTFINITENGIAGHETVRYYGYFGNDVYNSLQYFDEAGLKNYVKSRMGKGSNKFILGNYGIDKINPAENIVNIHADFEIPGYGKKLGDEYYINLNLEKMLESQVIDTSKRKIPKEIDYKYIISQYHILNIPAGYSATYIPKDFTFSNEMFDLKIRYELKDQKLIALQQIENKVLMVLPSRFNEWNNAIKAILPHYKESIVLEKK